MGACCRHSSIIDDFLNENPGEKYGANEDLDLVLTLLELQAHSDITKISKIKYYRDHTCSLKNKECQAYLVSARFENQEIENHVWTVKLYSEGDETAVRPGNTIVVNIEED